MKIRFFLKATVDIHMTWYRVKDIRTVLKKGQIHPTVVTVRGCFGLGPVRKFLRFTGSRGWAQLPSCKECSARTNQRIDQAIHKFHHWLPWRDRLRIALIK